MASKFKASHNIGTLFLAIIASFLLSTVVLLLPRFYCATESATEFPLAPVVLTRNLHGAPEPKVLPAISDEVKNVNESKPASSKSSPKAGADVEEFNSKTSNVTKGLHTPPLSLVGRISPVVKPMDISKILAMFTFMRDGHFVPETYPPFEKVAILIPYRNRRKHLYTLLPVLIPLLMRQNVQFGIFVIELDAPTTFNKGALFNAGFLEIMKRDNYDCIILHDVDLLPLDDRNLYRCDKDHPIHFSANIANYTSFYNGLFGGVVGFTPAQFKAINGASNMYFGWGGEDDDLRDRVLGRNITIVRKPSEFAHYLMVYHTRRGYWKANPNRFRVFAARRDRWSYDGLNSLEYKVTRVINKKVVIWINIAINATKIVETLPEDMRSRDEQDFGIDVEKGIINL